MADKLKELQLNKQAFLVTVQTWEKNSKRAKLVADWKRLKGKEALLESWKDELVRNGLSRKEKIEMEGRIKRMEQEIMEDQKVCGEVQEVTGEPTLQECAQNVNYYNLQARLAEEQIKLLKAQLKKAEVDEAVEVKESPWKTVVMSGAPKKGSGMKRLF